MSKSKLRAGIFLDHSNIYSPINKNKKLKKYAIDYLKLKEIMAQDYTLESAFAFLGVSDTIKPKKAKFIEYLGEIAGFIIMQRPLSTNSNGSYKQEQTDSYMHEYMDYMAEHYDVIILGTGDIDFLMIVRILLGMNKIVIIWSWKSSLHRLLREAVGEYNVYYIDNIWKDIRKLKQKTPR